MPVNLKGWLLSDTGLGLGGKTVEAFVSGTVTPAAAAVTDDAGQWAFASLADGAVWDVRLTAFGQRRWLKGGRQEQLSAIAVVDGLHLGAAATVSGLVAAHLPTHAHDTTAQGGTLSHANLTGVTSDQHHAAVTIGTTAAALLDVSGQELRLDAQVPNVVLGGPATGTLSVVPTFRALVAADLPEHTHASTDQGGTVAHSATTGRTVNDHHDKSHSHTVADGSGAISSDQNIRTTANFAGLTQNIADDAVYSFTPGAQYGLLLIGARAVGIQTSWALLQYRSTNPSNFMGIMVANAVVAVTTGALTGTTGADGAMTVSSHTDGKIYIENRLGGIIGLNIVVLGG